MANVAKRSGRSISSLELKTIGIYIRQVSQNIVPEALFLTDVDTINELGHESVNPSFSSDEYGYLCAIKIVSLIYIYVRSDCLDELNQEVAICSIR